MLGHLRFPARRNTATTNNLHKPLHVHLLLLSQVHTSGGIAGHRIDGSLIYGKMPHFPKLVATEARWPLVWFGLPCSRGPLAAGWPLRLGHVTALSPLDQTVLLLGFGSSVPDPHARKTVISSRPHDLLSEHHAKRPSRSCADAASSAPVPCDTHTATQTPLG